MAISIATKSLMKQLQMKVDLSDGVCNKFSKRKIILFPPFECVIFRMMDSLSC